MGSDEEIEWRYSLCIEEWKGCGNSTLFLGRYTNLKNGIRDDTCVIFRDNIRALPSELAEKAKADIDCGEQRLSWTGEPPNYLLLHWTKSTRIEPAGPAKVDSMYANKPRTVSDGSRILVKVPDVFPLRSTGTTRISTAC